MWLAHAFAIKSTAFAQLVEHASLICSHIDHCARSGDSQQTITIK